MDLQTVQDTAATCKLCVLCDNRIKPVYSRGSSGADIVV